MTLNQLIQIMPTAQKRAEAFIIWLNEFMPEYGITGVLREAAFLATIAEESGELRFTREIWGPTPAQERYEGRADLGNTEPGDGFKYRGRGLISITGRKNYEEASDALGHDYVEDPAAMQMPCEATRTACWWWQKHGCNQLADIGNFEGVTKRVNGGLTHFERRLAYYNKARDVL